MLARGDNRCGNVAARSAVVHATRSIMSIRKLLSVSRNPVGVDVALLLLRAVAGLAFMFHGWSKIQNPLGWMGPDAFAPGIFQALAALSEFGGGLAWIVGLLTPLASLGIASTMAVAFWFHAVLRGDPFVATGGGASYELAALYLCIALLLLAIGPGRLSLDRALFGRR
jgi:putative oxidoreductase